MLHDAFARVDPVITKRTGDDSAKEYENCRMAHAEQATLEKATVSWISCAPARSPSVTATLSTCWRGVMARGTARGWISMWKLAVFWYGNIVIMEGLRSPKRKA